MRSPGGGPEREKRTIMTVNACKPCVTADSIAQAATKPGRTIERAPKNQPCPTSLSTADRIFQGARAGARFTLLGLIPGTIGGGVVRGVRAMGDDGSSSGRSVTDNRMS